MPAGVADTTVPASASATATNPWSASASPTPVTAIKTPALLRSVSGSIRNAAATAMVSSGKVESASEARAAVV